MVITYSSVALNYKRNAGKKSTKVKRLFELALNLIANNPTQIESLVDFPSVVGEQIFEQVTKYGKLTLNSETSVNEQVEIWKKFGKAYGEQILPTLNLSNSLLLINEFHQPLSVVLENVVELDLSYCCLGASHDILSSISHMKWLQKLYLRKNGLTDITIQKMTMPVRCFNNGPQNIIELDLSGNNHLTDAIVPWLSGFKKLLQLNMSGTSLTEHGCKALEFNYGLQKCEESDFVSKKIETRGWAEPVINKWREILENRRKRKSRPLGQYSMCRGRRLYERSFTKERLPLPEPPEFKLLFKKKEGELPVIPAQEKLVPIKASWVLEHIEADIFDQYKLPFRQTVIKGV